MTPAPLLAENLAALGIRQDEVDLPLEGADVRLDRSGPSPVATIRTRSGQWVSLHSRRDPVAEADRWLSAAWGDARPELTIVIGLGLGYVLDAIEARSPAARVLAIEPDPALLRAWLERRSWREWIESGRLTLVAGPDYRDASSSWKAVPADAREPIVIVHPVIARERPAEVARGRAVVDRVLFDARANLDARRANAGRYLRNTLRNVRTIAREGDAGGLFDRFAGVPAILAAAGPSLDYALDPLRDAQDRAVVIAVDTAVRPLLGAGISPHLAVGLDPTVMNARHLCGLPDPGRVWLIAEGSLDPVAFSAFARRTFIFKVSDHEPWPWLRSLDCDRAPLRAWGSVLTSAFDLALRMGCDPIVFVGADLAFSGGRPYCRGTTFEADWADGIARGRTLGQIWRESLARWTLEPVPDVYGRPTRTAPHLLAFRDWLIDQMAARPDRHFVNAGGAGVLHGAPIRQATLAGALTGTRSISHADIAATLGAAHRETMDRSEAVIRAAGRLLCDMAIDPARPPEVLAGWRAFSFEQLSNGDLARALGTSILPETTESVPPPRGATEMAAAAASLEEALREARRNEHGARPSGSSHSTGALDAIDRRQLARAIEEHRPERVLVVGDASGALARICAHHAPAGARVRSARPEDVTATADEHDLIAVCLGEHAAASAPALEPFVDRLAARGVLALCDLYSDPPGLSARRHLFALSATRPDLQSFPLRTGRYFTRVALARRSAGGPSVEPICPPDAARTALMQDVVRRFRPSSAIVVGPHAPAWSTTLAALGVGHVEANDIGNLHELAREVDGTRVDLALCFDALHRLAPDEADSLIDFLTRTGDAIVFSTSPPGWEGVVARERPVAHWAQRLLARGFAICDELRPALEERPSFPSCVQELHLYAARRIVPAESTLLADPAWPAIADVLVSKDQRIEDLFLAGTLLRLERRLRSSEIEPTAGADGRVDLILASDRLLHQAGHAYGWTFATRAGRQYSQTASFADSILEEDGRPLAVAHALHEDICAHGAGRYSLSPGRILFSSSDNSDPRANGRTYRLEVPSYVYFLEGLPGDVIDALRL